MTVFKLPDLGEGLSEAEIVRWYVKVGDHVAVDSPLLSVETAKAVVEVPSPVSGTVIALHAHPGQLIEIGAPLLEFAADGAPHAAGAQDPARASRTTAETGDAGTVVGLMPGAATEPPVERLAGLPAPAVARPRVRAVPAARALARSLGVDLGALAGSGRDGLVTLEDVIGASGMTVSADPGSMPAIARSSSAASQPGDVEVLRSLRRTMAQSMAAARDSVMDCTVFDDADVQRWITGSDYSARVLRAIAAAARAEPGLNAWYEPASQIRRIFEQVDIGIAVDTPDGLLVPVIRQVQQLGSVEIRIELDRLKRAARERTLKSEELRHYTIMLSNFGTMAGRYATPVVLPPAVAILGTGRVRQDVLAVDGRVEIHARMPLSLTFDHRVVTGGEAVRFLAAVITDLEQPQ